MYVYMYVYVCILGGVFELGGGWYSKLRLQRSAGVMLKQIHTQTQTQTQTFPTAENIAEHFSRICDYNYEYAYKEEYDGRYPTSPADALKALMNTPFVNDYDNNNANNTGNNNHTSSVKPVNVSTGPVLPSDVVFKKLSDYISSNKNR